MADTAKMERPVRFLDMSQVTIQASIEKGNFLLQEDLNNLIPKSMLQYVQAEISLLEMHARLA